ncbi:MAG TPA: DEAD/DEAH box helicase, partial [Acidimicrobiales bacterium]|nr:DEAD/DEAH box helicase [Acidimicrobiales bacterium]
RKPRRVTAADALAAALTGTINVGGERVEVEVEGTVARLADRLRTATGASLISGDHGRELAEPDGLTAELRPYQRRGLAWLAEMADLGLGGCLADDMGLGKTIQVIALHVHRHLPGGPGGPTLVICPASVLGNWGREVERFAPAVPVRRYHGGDRHLEGVNDGEIVLATYGMVRRDRAALAEVTWGLVVADEAQQVKNPLSRTARELRAIPAAARIALTGTPVENRLTDLWAILDWTTPGLLGPLEGFQQRVAIPVERHRDPDATAAFGNLVRPFLLRRRKIDPGIAPDLPPKTETDQVVPLTAEQATLYEAVVREALADIATAQGINRRGLVLKLLTALKQVCNHPAQYLKQPGPLVGRSGKLEALDDLVDAIADAGDSVLVFTQYVAMARLLEGHLRRRDVPTVFLHGGVPPARRDALVDRFQAGEVPVFLLSLKAGGTGLNLTRATHVIHFDRWWNPAVEDQASDRAWRIGQDRPVQVHRLVTEGTVEDRIATLLRTKRELAEAVVG